MLEILISVAIFVLIAAGIFVVFSAGGRIFEVGNVQVKIEQEARKAIVFMTRELRQSSAGQINLIQGGGQVSSVTFQVPQSVDAGGNISWGAPIQYSLGGLNGKQILRLQGGNTTTLANDVIALNFDWPAASNVLNIGVIAEKTAFVGFSQSGNAKVTVALNGQVKLRN